jgi:hypothetical protein
MERSFQNSNASPENWEEIEKGSRLKYRFTTRFNLTLNYIILLGILINIILLRRRNKEKIVKREEILASLEDLNTCE